VQVTLLRGDQMKHHRVKPAELQHLLDLRDRLVVQEAREETRLAENELPREERRVRKLLSDFRTLAFECRHRVNRDRVPRLGVEAQVPSELLVFLAPP
jgi:hypothetical protein